MSKIPIKEDEAKVLAEDILNHCYGDDFNQDMINRTTAIIMSSLEKIMEQRGKPLDDYPYLISEDELRKVFEEQHVGRDLKRGRKGTYQSPQIAAIWNQHFKTARTIERMVRQKL